MQISGLETEWKFRRCRVMEQMSDGKFMMCQDSVELVEFNLSFMSCDIWYLEKSLYHQRLGSTYSACVVNPSWISAGDWYVAIAYFSCNTM